MPIEERNGQQRWVCDNCKRDWEVGTPRPTDFRVKKHGDMVEVKCRDCAPETLS